jgi:hypothetical protein
MGQPTALALIVHELRQRSLTCINGCERRRCDLKE